MLKECESHRRWLDTPFHRLVDLYISVARLHRNVLERELNRTGVYRSQHQLLLFIAEHPNASQKEVARLHHVSAATVAVSLKKLESGGYIRRVVDQEDNRYNQICITEKGEKIVEKSVRYFQTVEKNMFDGFSLEEMEMLYGYLGRIRKNLNGLLPEAEREEQE